MMIDYGNRHFQGKVCIFFNEKYSAHFSINGENENLRGLQTVQLLGKKIYITTLRNLNIFRWFVHKLMKMEKWHSYKIKFGQELSDNDLDRKIQFYQIDESTV